MSLSFPFRAGGFVEDCQFIGNGDASIAAYGASSESPQNALVISGGVFSGNTAPVLRVSDFGLSYGAPTIVSSTFYNNGAGAVGSVLQAGVTGTTILSSILWGNGDSPFSGPVNLEYNDIEGPAGVGTNFSADPLFVSTTPGAVDLRLSAGSPCIDRAPNDARISALDALGQARWDDPNVVDVNGTITDLGAYERQPQ